MNILVTAGNTQSPIDRVRCITNIFSGRTGTQIALAAQGRGHAVTLLTSTPEVANQLRAEPLLEDSGFLRILTYRTFDELADSMATTISADGFDAIVHSAAVSDYRVEGVFAKTPEGMTDASAGKVKSHHAELWMRLLPTPKLIDKIRKEWGFQGVLVKFKLEVGVSENELLEIAERSRLQSQADLMAANTLEGMGEWAFVGAGVGTFERVSRDRLADHIVERIERAVRLKESETGATPR